MDATDLYYLTRRLRALVEPEVDAIGSNLSLPVQIVLRDVIEFPGSTVSEISQRRAVAQSVVSKAVAEGREMGLVTTTKDPADRRRIRVRATPALKEVVYAHLSMDVREILAPALSDLHAGEVDAIVDALTTLLEAVKAHDLPPIDAP